MARQERITLGELFDAHIKPRHNVVCIGAYTGPHNDPSLLKATLITTRGKGSATLVDSQVDGFFQRLSERQQKRKLSPMQRKILKRLTALPHQGSGDPLQYLRAIRTFRSKGIRLKMPKLKIANATKTGFDGKQFDVLVDAGSLPWIHIAENDLRTSTRKSLWNPSLLTLQRIIDEYARISRKAIILFEPGQDRYPALSDVRHFLDETGINYSQHKVKNRYDLQLPNVRKKIYRHSYSYNTALVVEFGPRQRKIVGLT